MTRTKTLSIYTWKDKVVSDVVVDVILPNDGPELPERLHGETQSSYSSRIGGAGVAEDAAHKGAIELAFSMSGRRDSRVSIEYIGRPGDVKFGESYRIVFLSSGYATCV